MPRIFSKKDEQQSGDAAVESAPPASVPPAAISQLGRFLSDFSNTSGGFSQLSWAQPASESAIIVSKFGRLIHSDGTVVQLPAQEATALASRLANCRPNDKIQTITI